MAEADERQGLQGQVQRLIGTPWRLLGMTPETGFSCWGFIHWLYQEAGIVLPLEIHDAAALMRQQLAAYEGLPVPPGQGGAARLFSQVERPYQPYDILVFRQPTSEIRHLGCVLDAHSFAHCTPATNGVARSLLARWQPWLRYGVRYRPCA